MTRRFWAPEESARLSHLWANTEITAAQIAMALKRTERAVFHQVEKLGLPPRQMFWTPDEDERLKHQWPDRELVLRQIAERLRKSKKEVARRAQILGLPTRGLLYADQRYLRHAPYRWTPERNNTLRRLWLEGISAKEIAKQVNSTAGLVCIQRIKLGLPRRINRKSPLIYGRSERRPIWTTPEPNPPSLKDQQVRAQMKEAAASHALGLLSTRKE
jgi:hypothetical protein